MTDSDYTAEELRLCADAVEAKANCRPVEQCYRYEPWEPLGIGGIRIVSGWRYRPKPQPKTRDWTVADVPLNCWMKLRNDKDVCAMIVSIGFRGVTIIANVAGEMRFHVIIWSELKHWLYSTTRQPDSWHTCEVTEGEG